MISILDSGMGGVYFKHAMPFDSHLVIDKKAFPYGNKDLLWLKKHFIDLLDEIKSETVIVACNTLSSLIFYYQLSFEKQVVDVITPTIFYLRKNQYHHLLIMATANTIKMDIYGKLLHKKMDYYDASELIDSIESQNYRHILNREIDMLKGYDAILLGCTHLIGIKELLRLKLVGCHIISQDEIMLDYFSAN